jgi:hypothetical protein
MTALRRGPAPNQIHHLGLFDDGSERVVLAEARLLPFENLRRVEASDPKAKARAHRSIIHAHGRRDGSPPEVVTVDLDAAPLTHTSERTAGPLAALGRT